MSNNNFPLTLELRIDWGDMDLFGHVNNVAIFKYIQASRVNYWQKIGLSSLYEKSNQGPILASCSCNFKLPLFFPGQVVVEASVVYIKNSSFSIAHRILNGKGELAAEATDVIVMYDFNLNQKMTFPATFHKIIEEIEGKTF